MSLVVFTCKRYDGYFRIIINDCEYEGYINPDSFEYFEDKIRHNRGQAIKELETINGGKLTIIRKIEKSKNENLLHSISKHEKW